MRSFGSYYEFSPGQVYSGFGEEATLKDAVSPPVTNGTPVIQAGAPGPTIITIPPTSKMDPLVRYGLIAVGVGVVYKLFFA